MDDYKFKLGLAIAREEELKKKLEQVSVYDEAKERELFDLYFLTVKGFIDCGGVEGRDKARKVWFACAKSRARSAE